MPDQGLKHLFDLIPAAVVGGLIAFLGTLITVIATWAKDRNIDAKCIQAIDEATKYVQFYDAQVKALVAAGLNSTELETCKQQAITAVNAANIFLNHQLRTLQQSAVRERSVGPMRFWRKWLLLYRPRRWLTWVLRAPFYFYAFGGGLVSVGLAVAGLWGAFDPDLSRWLPAVLSPLYAALCYVFALPWLFISNWFDNRRSRRAVLGTL